MKLAPKTLLYFCIVFSLPACTFAQQDTKQGKAIDSIQPIQTWQLDNAVQWLLATDTKLYGLDTLGAITELDVQTATDQVVATAHKQSFLANCGDELVYINADSKLSTLNSVKSLNNPVNTAIEVAPFHIPTCLENGHIVVVDNDSDLLLVDAQGEVINSLALNALQDAQLRQADIDRDGSNEIIVLTQPTERYGHGVLGDRTEAESITVVDSKSWTVKANFQLPEPFVFEQLRVEVLDTGSKTLILGTRSSRQTGAGVIALEYEEGSLVQVGEAGVIGLGNRWLNLFDTANGEAYAIRTPHIGGPLQRYSFVASSFGQSELQLNSQVVGVTNHRIGSRNLDLAVLANNDDGSTSFIAPQYDQKTLEAFNCIPSETCESRWTFKLDNMLTSNLVIQIVDAERFVAAADQNGKVYLIEVTPF